MYLNFFDGTLVATSLLSETFRNSMLLIINCFLIQLRAVSVGLLMKKRGMKHSVTASSQTSHVMKTMFRF